MRLAKITNRTYNRLYFCEINKNVFPMHYFFNDFRKNIFKTTTKFKIFSKKIYPLGLHA